MKQALNQAYNITKAIFIWNHLVKEQHRFIVQLKSAMRHEA